MELNITPKGILQIDDAVITRKHFNGKKDDFHREGEKDFQLRIFDIDMAVAIVDAGYNVKATAYDKKDFDYLSELGIDTKLREYTGPHIDKKEPYITLKVKVGFNDKGPAVWLISGRARNQLFEDTIGILDDISIEKIDLDIRPYDWVVNGKSGRTAYLQGMEVVQRLDRFSARWQENEEEA